MFLIDTDKRSSFPPRDIICFFLNQRERLMPAWVSRQSTCLLEVDAIAADILNKNDVKGNLFGNLVL